MNITEVRMTKLSNSKALAIASITVGEDFVVTGLTVYNGQKGLWVSMPSRKNSKPDDGTDNYKSYLDIAYPITKSAREQIQFAVIEKYKTMGIDNTHANMEPKLNSDQERYERDKKNPSIDVTEDDLPF